MSFTVTIQPGNQRFEVDEDETILEAAERAGIEIPYGCQSGSCGACMGRLVSGEIDYPEQQPMALTPAEQAEGQVLNCIAHARSDVVLDMGDALPEPESRPRILPARVQRLERLAHDVIRLILKLPASETFHFRAGQYIDILMKDGRRRAFSLANTPNPEGLLELHVRHVPGGVFTDFVFQQLAEGDLLRIEGPLGNFRLHEDTGRPMLMVAGGTGLAPVKGIIEHALELGFTLPIKLFWGVRARRDLYLGEAMHELAGQHGHIDFTPVLSAPHPDDQWQGRTGYVHEAVLQEVERLGDYDIYVCGPPAMVETAGKALVAAGASPEHLYSDAFEYAADTLRAIRESRPG